MIIYAPLHQSVVKAKNFTHPWARRCSLLLLSSKLYQLGDWIYAAQSCLSRCTLEFPAVYADSLYPRCFSKGQITFLLCMLRKELAGRFLMFYQVMVIRRVAPTTNRSTNFRAHHFEFGNSCFYLLWQSALRTWPWLLYISSVLLQTFFFACWKVIFDLKKNQPRV